MGENHSPVINSGRSPIVGQDKDGLMGFPEAIKKVIDGARITRREWANKENYCYISGITKLLSIKIDKAQHSWILSEEDLTATDWLVV